MEYDKHVYAPPYTVRVCTAEKRGYFEHYTFGEDRGGGLWFDTGDSSGPWADDTVTLVDMDGPCLALPPQVAKALRDWGIEVPEEFE